MMEYWEKAIVIRVVRKDLSEEVPFKSVRKEKKMPPLEAPRKSMCESEALSKN